MGGSRSLMRKTFILKYLLLSGVMLLLPGCIPREAPASPGVETKVIDAKSHLPVGDVLVTAWADDKPEARNSAKTDSQGFVHVEALQRTVWMPPLPYDFAPPKGHVRFEAAGYQTRELDAQYVLRQYIVDHQPVELTPLISSQ